MPGFFEDLFDIKNFMPQGSCFLWYPNILWMHVISDIAIAFSYLSIALSICYIMKNNRRLRNLTFIMLAVFILMCGLTHLMNVIIMWYPVYRLAAVLKAATAGVAVAAAILLLPVMLKTVTIYCRILDQEDLTRSGDK
jgi:hypothetical protein